MAKNKNSNEVSTEDQAQEPETSNEVTVLTAALDEATRKISLLEEENEKLSEELVSLREKNETAKKSLDEALSKLPSTEGVLDDGVAYDVLFRGSLKDAGEHAYKRREAPHDALTLVLAPKKS
jgi:chromosome segregation ATPase